MLNSSCIKRAAAYIRKSILFSILGVLTITFGSINRNDVSIISINDKSDGYLLIAEVTYIPSIWFWILFVLTLFTWVGLGRSFIFLFLPKK